MDTEYENKMSRLGIKKGHTIEVVVREWSAVQPQRGGEILWTTTSKGFGSMHAVIKAIYEALPTYKGKRINVEVRNQTNGECTKHWGHCISKNRIPNTL